MATGQNFVPPLPLTQPTACRLFDPPYPPKTDSFARDPLRNHRHLAIAPLLNVVRHSSFGFLSSFAIRHSLFDTLCETGSWSQCASKPVQGRNGRTESG